MTEQDRCGYWFEKLKVDGSNLDEERKKEVCKALLMGYIGLSESGADTFIDLDFQLMAGQEVSEKQLLYLQAEKKVADFFSGIEEGSDENRLNYLRLLRKSLEGLYEEKELDEIFSLLDERSDTMVPIWLIGRDHPVKRKIRNAYLPVITDVFQLNLETGTYTELDIFNNGLEPCDNMDEFIKSLK